MTSPASGVPGLRFERLRPDRRPVDWLRVGAAAVALLAALYLVLR